MRVSPRAESVEKDGKIAMDCEGFLRGYSDFVDCRLDPAAHAAVEAHLERCDSCAHYDRVVQRGLFIYRNLPAPQPSPDFFPRLRHRLYYRDDGSWARGTSVGSAALVAVAAVGFLAVAWLPFATRVSVEVELPPVAVEAPPGELGLPSLFSQGPFLGPAAGYVSPAGMTVPAAGWDLEVRTRWSLAPVPVSWTASAAFPSLFESGRSGPAPATSSAR